MSVTAVSTRSRWRVIAATAACREPAAIASTIAPVLRGSTALSAAAELVQERRLAGQRVADLLDDLGGRPGCRMPGRWLMWNSESSATQTVVSVSCSIRSSSWVRRSRSSALCRAAAYPATGISTCRRTSSEVARGVGRRTSGVRHGCWRRRRCPCRSGTPSARWPAGPRSASRSTGRLTSKSPAQLGLGGKLVRRRRTPPVRWRSRRCARTASIALTRRSCTAVWLSDRFTTMRMGWLLMLVKGSVTWSGPCAGQLASPTVPALRACQAPGTAPPGPAGPGGSHRSVRHQPRRRDAADVSGRRRSRPDPSVSQFSGAVAGPWAGGDTPVARGSWILDGEEDSIDRSFTVLVRVIRRCLPAPVGAENRVTPPDQRLRRRACGAGNPDTAFDQRDRREPDGPRALAGFIDPRILLQRGRCESICRA